MTLSGREKRLVFLGSAIAAVILALELLLMPAFDKRDSLKKQLESKHASLETMNTLRREYSEILLSGKAAGRLVQDRPKNFTLFSFLDTLAQETGVKDNVVYMKPSSVRLEKSQNTISIVKLKLDNLVYAELAGYLMKIETAPAGVFIKSIALSKTGKEMNYLEAVIEAQTLIPGEPS